jgi:hypothetical protein
MKALAPRVTAIQTELEQLNPSALYFEPRAYLDSALIGVSVGPANRSPVAVYSEALLQVALGQSFLDSAAGDGEETEEYVESGVLEQDVDAWMGQNLLGLEMGEQTPLVVRIATDAE